MYPEFQKERVNFLLTDGGLGDNICRFPIIKYIINTHPHVEPQVWVMDFVFDLARHLLPDIDVYRFSDNKHYNQDLPARSTGTVWFTNLKTHMIDHAFALLANEIPQIEHKNYLQLNLKRISINKFNLPKKYVCIFTGYTAPIRRFYEPYVNEIVDYIKEKGYDIIFMGQRQSDAGLKGHEVIGTFSEEIDYSKGLNLIDRTSLLEAGKIISGARCVVGLDSGLCHLSAMTQVPIVCGFTSVDPLHRMPIRNNQLGWNFYPVVPPDDQPEKFCQSRWDFEFNHDFRFSYYKNDDLIKSVTPNLYIKEINKLL